MEKRKLRREYVVPANPNTTDQQTQRNKFTLAVAFGKLILGSVLNVFVDPYQKTMSGFNYFIKQNIAFFTATPSYPSVLLTFGKLYFGGIIAAILTSTTVNCSFSTDTGSNGSASDKVYGCVYDTVSGKMFFNVAGTTARSAGATGLIITVGSGLTAANLKAYLWVASYDTNGKLVLVSNSDFQQVI
jgi:hypothetical protein